MGQNSAFEENILQAWQRNARPWADAVRDRQIVSRREVTDQAVLEAIRHCAPSQVLDIGCGEGWLTRAVSAQGMTALGVDGVAELVALASAAGGDFQHLTYEQLAGGELAYRADLAVCNFSLLGETSVEALFAAMPILLNPAGYLIVQTLHPLVASEGQVYQDGWRSGSWDGCDGDFSDPAPWYFRTLESWLALFMRHDLRLLTVQEPLLPATGRPASLIITGQLAG